MAGHKKLIRRIIFLIFILTFLILGYFGFRARIITLDPMLVKLSGVIFTFLVSLLSISILLRLTENKIWNMFSRSMELEQRMIITKLYSVSLYSLAIFITFWKAGVSLASLTIFAGLIASGFAFAIRDILLSFFAWFVILNKKPFQIGDFVVIHNNEGLVTRIGTFFFTLEKGGSEEFIKVPNNFVLLHSIINRGDGKYREELLFSLKHFPVNLESINAELATFIRSRNAFKDHIKVQLHADSLHWYLQVQYFTSGKQDSLRGAITQEVSRLYKECLKLD